MSISNLPMAKARSLDAATQAMQNNGRDDLRPIAPA